VGWFAGIAGNPGMFVCVFTVWVARMLDLVVLLPAAGHIHIPYGNHYGDD